MKTEQKIQEKINEIKNIISKGLSKQFNSFRIDYNVLKNIVNLNSDELNECLNSITNYKVWEIVINYE